MSSSYQSRQRSPPRRDRSRSRERGRDRRDDDDNGRRREQRRDDFGRDIYSDRDTATGRRDPPPPRRRDVSRSRSRERQPQNAPSSSLSASRVEEKASVAQLIAAKNQAKQERLAMVQSLVSGTQEVKKVKIKTEDAPDDEAEEDDDEAIMEMMGFAGFNSTKGKPVEENLFGPASGAAAKGKARKYRQYMNRKGGFNRPLQKMD